MTKMTTTRYSPEPIGSYRFAPLYKFLTDDPVAWDLAYLSWDFEACKEPPDAQFSTVVRRTLQFVTASGRIDLANTQPPNLTVRGLMRHPAPRAVKLILDLHRLPELPLFQAYSTRWLDTFQTRSHLYREPHDKDFDFDVNVLTQATEVISKFR